MKDYTDWLVAGGASPTTVRLRRYYVRRLSERVQSGPWSVSTAHLVEFLAVPEWSAETRKSARSSVRTFYRWAVESGRIASDPAYTLPPVRVPQGQPRPTPRTVVDAALAHADTRDRLMILLAVLAGLRRSEIARVRTADVLPDLLGYSLRVTGKGGKVRTVPLHPALASALTALPRGFAFPGKDHGHLSPGWVGKRLARALGSGWSGHTLRHRFATEAYAVERDLFAVQRLLGHSKPETTARYTAIPDTSLRAAVTGMRQWAA